jgi:peptide/nickel transport system ATP-binding protein
MLGISDAAAKVTGGSAVFGGIDLLQADEATLQELRGREISMIFQSPRTALNPIRPVGQQIEDVLRRHAVHTRAGTGPDAARGLRERAIQALRDVAIADPERRADAYPFELSGGMCQRVMIAIALACRPGLLIADEPTTGLDVTTQAAVMDLITAPGARTQMATLFITHDLGLAADHCDRIVVMHAGHAVEARPRRALFSAPRHPYTARLIVSTPARSTLLTACCSRCPGSCPTCGARPAGLPLQRPLRTRQQPCRRESLPPLDAGADARRGLLAPAGGAPEPAHACRRCCRSNACRAAFAVAGPRGAQLHAVDDVSCSIAPARAWAWWANRAAASRPWCACWRACSTPARAASSSRATTWPPAGAPLRPPRRSAPRSRWSSRTRPTA